MAEGPAHVPRPGAGRRIGAGMMVAGALLVLVGLLYVSAAVADVDDQAGDLDPSESRLQRAFFVGSWGAAAAGLGLASFLIGVVPYTVSAYRVGKHGAAATPAPRIASVLAAALVAACLLFAFLAPSGPFMQAASLASGGGPGSVQLEEFQGSLNAASAGGASTAEGVHPFTPLASYGSLKVRFEWASPTTGASGRLLAILEAEDGRGGWTELGSTDGSNSAEIDVAPRDLVGDLRVRVVVSDPGLLQADYGGMLAIDPTP